MPKITHLQRRGHRYWMRVAVPHALRAIVGKAELVGSLHTTDLNVAKQRLAFEVSKANAILRSAQHKLEVATSSQFPGGFPILACANDPEWVAAMRWLQKNMPIVPSPQIQVAEPLRRLGEPEQTLGAATVRAAVLFVKFAPPAARKVPTFGELRCSTSMNAKAKPRAQSSFNTPRMACLSN